MIRRSVMLALSAVMIALSLLAPRWTAATSTSAGCATASASPSPAAPRAGMDRGVRTRPSAQRLLTVLPFGDSFTLGVDSTDGRGYRSVLAQIRPDIRFVGTLDADPWRHDGHSGWRTDQLMDVPVTSANVALVHVGTNDDGAGRTADQMVAGARALVDRLLAGGVALVLLAQIPRTPINTAVEQEQEDLFDAALPGLAAGYGGRVIIVDMTGIPINAGGVHPTQDGYVRMAYNWAAYLP